MPVWAPACKDQEYSRAFVDGWQHCRSSGGTSSECPYLATSNCGDAWQLAWHLCHTGHYNPQRIHKSRGNVWLVDAARWHVDDQQVWRIDVTGASASDCMPASDDAELSDDDGLAALLAANGYTARRHDRNKLRVYDACGVPVVTMPRRKVVEWLTARAKLYTGQGRRTKAGKPYKRPAYRVPRDSSRRFIAAIEYESQWREHHVARLRDQGVQFDEVRGTVRSRSTAYCLLFQGETVGILTIPGTADYRGKDGAIADEDVGGFVPTWVPTDGNPADFDLACEAVRLVDQVAPEAKGQLYIRAVREATAMLRVRAEALPAAA